MTSVLTYALTILSWQFWIYNVKVIWIHGIIVALTHRVHISTVQVKSLQRTTTGIDIFIVELWLSIIRSCIRPSLGTALCALRTDRSSIHSMYLPRQFSVHANYSCGFSINLRSVRNAQRFHEFTIKFTHAQGHRLHCVLFVYFCSAQ